MAVGGDLGLGPIASWWNGFYWTETPPVDLPGINGPDLTAVSCTSTTNCIAVGSRQNDPETLPLVERWNGIRWSIEPTPRPTPSGVGSDTQLRAISCQSARACVAVGYQNGDEPLAERWNGGRWSIQSTPGGVGSQPGAGGTLVGLSCVSSTACVAVGLYSTDVGKPLIEQWDGSHWSIQPTPDLLDNSSLNAVSCTSSTSCTAVGSKAGQPFIARWKTGRWSIQTTPRYAGGQQNGLESVSCASRKVCTAVGATQSGDNTRTLVLRWGGSSWTREPSPSAARNDYDGSWLNAVSCTSVVICTAVGWGDRDGFSLAEQRAAAASNRFTVSGIRTYADGTFKLRITIPGPGTIEVIETASNDNLAKAATLLIPAPKRFAFAHTTLRARHAGTLNATTTPNVRGKLLIAHHRYRIGLRLWVAYTPRNGRPHQLVFHGLRLSTSSRP